MKIEFGALKVEMDGTVGLVAVVCWALVAVGEVLVKMGA